MVKARVLEPIDMGSILVGGFHEGNHFTTRHGMFGGRPTLGCGISGYGLQRATEHSSPTYIAGPSAQPLVHASRCALYTGVVTNFNFHFNRSLNTPYYPAKFQLLPPEIAL